MIRKTTQFFWSVRHQFAKFLFVGGSGVFIDMGLLILLKEVFFVGAVLAVVLNQLVVMVYNFSLNKYWTFRSSAMPHKQLVRYIILIGCNYVFGIVMMYVFHQIFELDYRLVRLGTIGVMGMWNFFVYKYWVYR